MNIVSSLKTLTRFSDFLVTTLILDCSPLPHEALHELHGESIRGTTHESIVHALIVVSSPLHSSDE